jgi:Ca2+-binding RTX toxin-like protein
MLVGSLSAAGASRGGEPVMCFGREATILGTTASDQYPDAVFGTTASDVIHALAGDDNVYAVALDADPNQEVGDDYVCAGPGHDDPVDGGGGDDHIAGGTGSDSLFGHRGSDTMLGGYGNDEIVPHNGHDVVDGGPGRDHLCAMAGRDEIRGADGADALATCGGPQTGADRYLGGPGDDLIYSVNTPEQTSGDVVNGGSGNDTCTIDPEDTARNCETVEVI